MLVKELIALLTECHPDVPVMIYDSGAPTLDINGLTANKNNIYIIAQGLDGQRQSVQIIDERSAPEAAPHRFQSLVYETMRRNRQ